MITVMALAHRTAGAVATAAQSTATVATLSETNENKMRRTT